MSAENPMLWGKKELTNDFNYSLTFCFTATRQIGRLDIYAVHPTTFQVLDYINDIDLQFGEVDFLVLPDQTFAVKWGNRIHAKYHPITLQRLKEGEF